MIQPWITFLSPWWIPVRRESGSVLSPSPGGPGPLRPLVPVWGSPGCSASPETTARLRLAPACRWETGRVSVRRHKEIILSDADPGQQGAPLSLPDGGVAAELSAASHSQDDERGEQQGGDYCQSDEEEEGFRREEMKVTLYFYFENTSQEVYGHLQVTLNCKLITFIIRFVWNRLPMIDLPTGKSVGWTTFTLKVLNDRKSTISKRKKRFL